MINDKFTLEILLLFKQRSQQRRFLMFLTRFQAAWCNFIFHHFEKQLYFLIKLELCIKLESILKCTRMKLRKHSWLNEIANRCTVLWVTKAAARRSPHSLHSNSFHDRPDVIKWHVAGDGCQEEAASFIGMRFGGYRAFWSAGEHAYRTVRVKSPNAATAAILLCEWQRVVIHSWR